MMIDIRNILICSLIGVPVGISLATIFCWNTTKKGTEKFFFAFLIVVLTSISIGFLIYGEEKAEFEKAIAATQNFN